AFKRLGRSHRIFCLVIDGEPFSSAGPENAERECLPPALRYEIGEDGELTDTLAATTGADVRLGKESKDQAKIKLIAGLLGTDLAALRQLEQQQRTRRLVAVTAFSTVGMVIALALATTAVIARQDAERERLRAEAEAETARETASFMVSLFQVSDPSEERGKSITAREILTAGASRVEYELEGQPEIQTQLMYTMGGVFSSLGLYGDARDMLDSALARRRTLPEISELELSQSLVGLGDILTETAEFDEAEALYLESIERLNDSALESSDEMDNSLAGLAELYFNTGRYADAEPILAQVLANRRKRLGENDPAVADAIAEIGLNQFDQGNLEAAEERLRFALAMRRQVLGDAPHPDVAENLNNLALLLEVSESYQESELLYREAMMMNESLYGEVHPDVASGLNNLGYLYRSQGKLEQAKEAYLQALAIDRQLFGEKHPDVAVILSALALNYYDQGNLEQAIDFITEALDIQTAAFGEEHPEVAASMSVLGRFLSESGQTEEAEARLRRALALYGSGLLEPDHPDVAIPEMVLADLLANKGELTEALELSTVSHNKLAAAFGEDHWLANVAYSIQGGVLSSLQRFDEAEPILLQSYSFLESAGTRPQQAQRARNRIIAHFERSGDEKRAARYRKITEEDGGTALLTGG
ncbi:MAG: tetratricopeptide repeat protein, partial [Pseudomonadota bacterium]